MSQEPEKVYITVTTKPLGIAVRERLPAAYASVSVDKLEEANLVELTKAAIAKLGAGDGAD